jgi:predicted ATPase/DNA-binding SARP family transcriptional activator
LRLAVGGVDVAVPGPKRRAVLALLAMASPSPVSVDSLILAVWPDELSGSGAAALQSHVSRLRRHLGAAASRLDNGPGGYRLRLEPDELDATHAADLIGQARRTASSDAGAGLALVREARRLWRGSPLEEFADVEALSAWRRSLEEQRLAAAELHAELAVATGEFQEAVEVTGAIVSEDGLREASVLLLMTALAGCGRAAEALRAGYAHRRLLADQVGLEPSAAVGALEHAIAAGGAAPVGVPVWRRPTQVIPTARSALIGRDAELAGIARLSQSECLVSLVGPGGVGKTRLAFETARRDRSGRDVAVVSLASVTDQAALAGAVAAALGLRGNIGDPLLAVVALLESRPWLVVLDNCEHLLHPVRQLVATLTSACPDLTVVATSRERLGLPVEQVCRIAPLPLPAHDQGEDLESVPAVALFLERAKRVRSDFQPRDDELAVIADIVRRLDGMPLAIELAAGRLASLSVGDLAARLDRALDLLRSSTDAGVERHSTLRAAIEWSYELLPQHQQRLFRALAVFPDGVDLATAEDVARDVAPSADPTGSVAHLVDASMLVATFGGVPRYRMLETLRSFGLDRLWAHHEYESATSRFLRWAESFVNWVDRTVATAEEPFANQRLLAELGNLRAAWHLARSSGNLDLMATLVVSLHWPGVVRDLGEIWGWAVELAADSRIIDHPRAGSVLGAASGAMWLSGGDLDGAQKLAQRGLALAGDHDPLSTQRCLGALGDVALFEGRFEEAAALYLRGGDGTLWQEALCANAAFAVAYAGRLDEGRTLNLKAAGARCPTALAFHHYAAGEIDNLDGAWKSAQGHYRDALRLTELSGATFVHAVAAVGLVSVQAAGGEFEAALRGYAELIDYWERTGAWTQQWTTLRNVADLLDRLGDHDAGSLLRAAADDAPEAASTTLAACRQVTTVPDGEVDPPQAPRPASTARTREQVLDIARQSITRHLNMTADDRGAIAWATTSGLSTDPSLTLGRPGGLKGASTGSRPPAAKM